MTAVAFMGLGRMGYPMAGHLAAAGHDVAVFDVVGDAVDRFVGEHGGRAASNPGDAATGAAVVLSSLPADADLRAVAYDGGLVGALEPGAVWVDHSTTSATVATELAEATAAVGAGFVDAPVSGGVQGAENGALAVMIGGSDRDVAAAMPLIDSYAARANHMGPTGSGQLTKMANQICVVGLTQALAEGLDFAQTSGLDVMKVVEVMLTGSSASWEMEHRSEFMFEGEYDFGFSTDLMRKDIGLVLEEADNLAIPLPVTALVDGYLAEVQEMGGSQWDWCSLMERQRASH